jgi:hypothetical protein
LLLFFKKEALAFVFSRGRRKQVVGKPPASLRLAAGMEGSHAGTRHSIEREIAPPGQRWSCRPIRNSY